MVRLRLLHREPMECVCCLTSKPASDFPLAPATQSCEHPARTCQDCLDEWIYVSLVSNYTPNLRCPECDQHMVIVQDLKDHHKSQMRCYEIHARVVKGMTPGWRWCLEEDCLAGRVHENASKQRREQEQPQQQEEEQQTRAHKVRFSLEVEQELPLPDEELPSLEDMDIDDSDIWTCHAIHCAGQACAVCDRPWHEGLTCSEYAWRNMKHLVEDALSLKVVAFLRAQGRIRDCPNCQCPIERDGVGSQVLCSRCLCKFQWDAA